MINAPVVQWLERRSYKAVTIVRLYPGVLEWGRLVSTGSGDNSCMEWLVSGPL